MRNWVISFTIGRLRADLITMCSMLHSPICMHNVAEKDIYRPAAWNAFGMDKEVRTTAPAPPMVRSIKT